MVDFAEMAQDFVEATSPLVRGRTINIMSREGIIIASTEHHRIGDFHQGAAEVIKTGKTVVIKKENLMAYTGAREGCNMPIFLKDDLIGVVGIFGNEEEVRDVANLLRVYVTQHFAQQEMAQKQKLESEMRTQLLQLLILGDSSQIETISQISTMLDLQIAFPVRIALIYGKYNKNQTGFMHDYSAIAQDLLWKGVLDRRKDICGIRKQGYVMILSSCRADSSKDERIRKLIQAAGNYKGYRIAVSSCLRNLADIPEGMKEVSVLKEIPGGEIQDIEWNQCKMEYLFYKALIHGGERYAEQMYQRLCSREEAKLVDELLATAGVYFQEQRSIAKASQQLHVHKNTLLYRLKRLYQLLEMEDETPFVREFMIRIMIQYKSLEISGTVSEI